jgi:hypothetical protein
VGRPFSEDQSGEYRAGDERANQGAKRIVSDDSGGFARCDSRIGFFLLILAAFPFVLVIRPTLPFGGATLSSVS